MLALGASICFLPSNELLLATVDVLLLALGMSLIVVLTIPIVRRHNGEVCVRVNGLASFNGEFAKGSGKSSNV